MRFYIGFGFNTEFSALTDAALPPAGQQRPLQTLKPAQVMRGKNVYVM